MALSSNALKKSVTAAPEEHDRRSSPDVHWAWSRIFADFEQRAAVFTDPRLPDNPVLYATKDFYDLTGYAPADVIGRNCRFLQGPDTDPVAVAAIRAALAEQLPITVDILNYRKDGAPFWNRLRIKPVFGPGNTVERLIGVQDLIEEFEVRPGVFLRFLD